MEVIRMKLNWVRAFTEKFGTPKNLVKLFKKSPHIKEGMKNGLLFGELRTWHDVENRSGKNIFEIKFNRVCFTIINIKLNTKGDVVLDVIPVEPLGPKCMIDELIEGGFYILQPRVPNLGTKENKRLIPITFDLIKCKNPSPINVIEIKHLTKKKIKNIKRRLKCLIFFL